MVGSEATDRRCLRHHLMDGDDDDDDRGVELESHRSSGSGVSCSICLDLVSDDGKRSRAKLHCGHEFHLDCIGSAFNMKGAMQCPNCRKVEKGQWLYANGSSCSLPEFNMEDLIPDEDPYDLSYAEMPFRVHWCPFGGLPRLRSSFEEMDYPSTTYNGFPGHHALFSEHATASSVAHSYIAYYRPVPLASSNSADSVDDPNLNHHWNGPPGHSEIFDPHTFSAIHNHHHSWGHHAPGFPTSSSHINGADPTPVAPATQRSAHGESDVLTRSRPFPHPFVFGHGSGPGAGSSYVSSTASHHPSSNARVSHAFHHPLQQTSNSHNMPSSMVPGIRRLDGQIVPPPPLPQFFVDNFYVFPPSSGQNSHEADNAALEREHSSGSGWHSSSFHQAADPGNRTGGGMWHGQWPWRS